MFWVFVKKLWYRIYAGLFILSKNERKKFRKEQTLKAERKYLKRYLHILNGIDKNPAYSEEERNIWVCWFQGEAQAPEIVKRCLESIRQNANGCKVVLIDNENIKKYANIPDYIFEKRRKRLITPMQFSDILRATLLADRGGVWIDATVLLTAPLSSLFTQQDFFCLSSKGIYRNVNWMIGARAKNPLMAAEKAFLFEYWKKENRLIDYFLYPLAFDFLVDNDSDLKNLWSQVPIKHEDNCYLLKKNYFTKFDESLWQKITDNTHIHKLSYKYDPARKISGTFLEKILRKKI